jgi:hypothetical protein
VVDCVGAIVVHTILTDEFKVCLKSREVRVLIGLKFLLHGTEGHGMFDDGVVGGSLLFCDIIVEEAVHIESDQFIEENL